MTLFNGLLGKKNVAILGRTFNMNPGIANGSEGFTYRAILGENLFLPGENLYDATHGMVTISASPISKPNPGTHIIAINSLQLLLSFCGGGDSVFGLTQDPPISPPGANLITQLSQDIAIDCDNAVVSLTSSASFQLKFRYTTSKIGIPFVAGDDLGPNFRVNVGCGYGTPKNVQSWCTDVSAFLGISGGIGPFSAWWAKPQFAEALTVDLPFSPTLNTLGGEIRLNFYNTNGLAVKRARYLAPYTSFPLIRWPQHAHYVEFDMSHLTCTNPAITGTTVTPVHAIRF